MAESAGAEFAAAFNVILLGKGRDVGGVPAQLPQAPQHDLGAAVVAFDLAFNFDLLSLQLPDIAYMLQIAGKHHNGERADAEVVAKVEEMDAAAAELHLENFPGDAAVGTNVFLGIGKGNAGRGRGRGHCTHERDENENSLPRTHVKGGGPILRRLVTNQNEQVRKFASALPWTGIG